MGAFQEVEDIFFEVRSSIDLSFVQKWSGPSGFDLAGDLFRDPSVLRAMAYENKQLV